MIVNIELIFIFKKNLEINKTKKHLVQDRSKGYLNDNLKYF